MKARGSPVPWKNSLCHSLLRLTLEKQPVGDSPYICYTVYS